MPRKRKSADNAEDIAAVSSKTKASKGADTRIHVTTQGKGKNKHTNAGARSGGSADRVNVSTAALIAKVPKRNSRGQLMIPDHPTFRPNLTPKEVMQLGSFGGSYFRPIRSSVTNKSYEDVWKEFPADWFEGLKIEKQVANPNYLCTVNRYGVSCGGDLHMWESNGWMRECDPYGWFQWYCRFYLGRRCDDDQRQISRGLKVFGPTGRWRTQLCNRILTKGTDFDDPTVSPKIRQLLQHWGYKLTEADLQDHFKKTKKG